MGSDVLYVYKVDPQLSLLDEMSYPDRIDDPDRLDEYYDPDYEPQPIQVRVEDERGVSILRYRFETGTYLLITSVYLTKNAIVSLTCYRPGNNGGTVRLAKVISDPFIRRETDLPDLIMPSFETIPGERVGMLTASVSPAPKVPSPRFATLECEDDT